jgi:hypothetical protein
MNNDLDVKGAIYTLIEAVTGIHRKLGTRPMEEIENIVSDLRRIDTVLMCLF